MTEIWQSNILILTSADWDFLVELMNAPVEINPNLKKAAENFQKAFEDKTEENIVLKTTIK